ncbi:MAG: hypothetical protein CMJ83_18270 [Planctomycetes bacterium]|nr:hypothetical protein [Planctomycetota bacterium]
MNAGLNVRLSTMMFLQYGIWGAWLPLLWPFLNGHRGFDGSQIGDMFAVGAVGAIVAPFIAGQVADRWFPTQVFLGISHLIGAVIVWLLADLETYGVFLVFSLLYSLVYSPTLSLTNSLAFHHIEDRDRDFGKVRVWGTIGWIVVGILIGQWLKAQYTIDDTEAASRVFDARVAEASKRDELLTRKQVVLKDGRTPAGRIVRDDSSGVVLEIEIGDGDAKKTETRTIARDDVEEVRPLWAALAAEGKGPELETALRAAQAEGADLPAIRAGLVQNEVFSRDALNGPIGAEHARGMADAFRLSAILGALMGIFCFMLPHTPPSRGAQKNAAFEAITEVKRQPLLTLFLLAVPVSCIHQFYFVHTAGFLGRYQLGAADTLNTIFGVGGGGLMTVGQMTEIAVLAFIPVFSRKFSRKSFLMLGLVAYGLRMLLFAHVDSLPMPPIVTLVLGVALHGFCFGCFIFVAFMIVDEECKEDVKASAQSLFNLVIVGLGIIVGSKIAGWVSEWATTSDALGDQIDYTRLFSVPMWGSVACLVLLLVFYPRKSLTAG